ncbi:AI-2E family transporter [Synechococcus sp. Nb3U1]|uniref:AI-2E family transporter n=1 Tax=Synechococcus sp. Nb3U1 TaxID=1914529 RepID=UPI001F3FA2C8|nr:AI-2E family transporter [Synechococcus sp. Nb3U1]MCF2971688.1 AI-2E family transporter [Synechococcus sp. Nb3U1]
MPEPSRWPVWAKLNNSQLLRILLFLACAWALSQVLSYFELVITIFVIAAILAYLLSYPVGWLTHFFSHNFSVYLVTFVTVISLSSMTAVLGLTLISQLPQLQESIATFLNTVFNAIDQLELLLGNFNIEIDIQEFEQQIKDQTLNLLGSGVLTLRSLLLSLVNLFLIFIVAFFMLLDGKRLWSLFLKPFSDEWQTRITETVRRNFLGFFWGRVVLSFFFAVSSFLVFLVFRIPSALTLSMIAGLFDLIPGIGATIGISLIALILLPKSVWLSIQVLVICISLQQVEENLLLPRVMQGSLNISPVVMFFSLFVGGTLAGLLGVFLAIPVTGVLINLLEIDEMKGDPKR